MLEHSQIERICREELGQCAVSSDEWLDNGLRVVRIFVGKKANLAYQPTSEWESLRKAKSLTDDERIIKLLGGEDENYFRLMLKPTKDTLPENRTINNTPKPDKPQMSGIANMGNLQPIPPSPAQRAGEPIYHTPDNPPGTFAGISNQNLPKPVAITPDIPLQNEDTPNPDKLGETLDRMTEALIGLNKKINKLIKKRKVE